MFFIAPQRREQALPACTVPATRTEERATKRRRTTADISQDLEQIQNYYPRRIARACDRCRLRKTRCNGGKICGKCKQDGVVCVTTTNSKKNDHARNFGYVQLVESQRDQLLQALHKVLQNSTFTESASMPALLAEMGISIDNLRGSAQNANAQSNVACEPSTSFVLDDILRDFDSPQLKVLTSLFTTIPQQHGLSLQHTEMNTLQDCTTLHSDNAQTSFATDTIQPAPTCWLEQNAISPEECDYFWDSSDLADQLRLPDTIDTGT